MATYIILSKLTSDGVKRFRKTPETFGELAADVANLDGKVVSQFALLGDMDFCTMVSLPDNAAAHTLAGRTPAGAERTILPAIDLALFQRLLGQTTETEGPHRWQVNPLVRLVRPLAWWYTSGRPSRKLFQPFKVHGKGNLKGLKSPVIVIANHTSHMDSIAMYYALPFRIRRHLMFGGAADRWFIKGRKGMTNQPWWASLTGSFPIVRGGGSKSLDYPKWLIDKGESIAIFPEGTRSRSGKMSRFKAGPSILAVSKGVPVIPMYFEGMRDIRAVGSRDLNPGPATVLIGEPIRFAPDTDIGEATHTLYKAVAALQQEAPKYHPARKREAAPVAAVAG